MSEDRCPRNSADQESDAKHKEQRRRVAPRTTPKPVTRIKANIMPRNTIIWSYWDAEATTANWVLSPNSAKAIRASDDAKETISMAYEGLGGDPQSSR